MQINPYLFYDSNCEAAFKFYEKVLGGHFHKPQGFAVSLTVKDPAEGERKFKALCEGGSTNMPFGKTFFSKGFGMCVDQFGIPWMVNCPLEGQ
jgi:PhnB protein